MPCPGQEPLYIVRDSAGAIYGPAAIGTLQQWIGEGRITAQMQVAPQGTQTFQSAGQMPELLAAFTPASLPTANPTPTQNQAPQNQPYGYPNVQPNYYAAPKKLGAGHQAADLRRIGGFFCGVAAIVAIIMGHIARDRPFGLANRNATKAPAWPSPDLFSGTFMSASSPSYSSFIL